jgi:hypothetical protein
MVVDMIVQNKEPSIKGYGCWAINCISKWARIFMTYMWWSRGRKGIHECIGWYEVGWALLNLGPYENIW